MDVSRYTVFYLHREISKEGNFVDYEWKVFLYELPKVSTVCGLCVCYNYYTVESVYLETCSFYFIVTRVVSFFYFASTKS